ncbi:MAG TPA: LysR family transcriptional regulator [Candidatus Faecalibacterium intestinigallinarum]|uniref:LysR family transcriptional regulator n=1 Tax=Candidatus Faecalibacterium intestinigallinarum TaxID=2838581 RepID=A0A9D1TW08_9FIRM|nr:LysR family transcriptional regulator [Candidatus Faecalibacterium intestinigallinarum]
MTINYDYYRIFYVVAQCRSFTRAAEVLQNNQPNITRCMKNLEQELGCKLFHRSNKGITLTPEGQRFYRRVAAAVEQLQQGEEEIRRDGSLESGSLSISASEAALHMILLDKLSAFRARYPGVHLRITNETTPQAIERLRSGESDFAVITAPLLTGRSLQQTELLRFAEIPVCGPAYSEMAAHGCTLAELARCPLVCLGEGTSTYAFYQSFFNAHGQPFRVDVEAATMDQILPMVEHGLGIGFYPAKLAAPRIGRGELFCIPLELPVPERAISLVEDAARPRSTAMKTMREMICGKE